MADAIEAIGHSKKLREPEEMPVNYNVQPQVRYEDPNVGGIFAYANSMQSSAVGK